MFIDTSEADEAEKTTVKLNVPEDVRKRLWKVKLEHQIPLCDQVTALVRSEHFEDVVLEQA